MGRAVGRALSRCAHADPLPRWRDDRHRLAAPAHHRTREGPHRLRDVPGQPERVDPEPDPVRLRPEGARRRPADPRPPRPLRSPAAAGQGRLSRPDPRDGRNDRAGRPGPARFGQAPRGVRQARGPLGEAPPRQGRRRRPEGSRPVRGGRRAGRGRRRRGDDGQRRRVDDGRDRTRRRDSSRRRRRERGRGRRGHRARRDDRRAGPREPADRVAERPRGAAAGAAARPPDRPRRSALHRQGRRGLTRVVQGRVLRRGGRGRAGCPRDVRGRRAHPRFGDHPAAGPGARGWRGADHRLLGRPRPSRHADPARSDGHDRRRLRPHRIDLRWA